MPPIRWTLLAILAAAVLAGCADRQGREPPASSLAPAETGLEIWTVVGYHLPGTGAMDSAAAHRWLGRSVRFEVPEAYGYSDHCDLPRYALQPVATDSFLAAEYHLPPGALPPLRGMVATTVLDISCNGVPWTAFGGRLIEIDSNRALAPWDGTWFEVARDNDFLAVGTDPFWELVITRAREIRLTRHDGGADVVVPAPLPFVDARTKTVFHHAVSETDTLRIAITPDRCRARETVTFNTATVTIWLNGERQDGCGGPLR